MIRTHAVPKHARTQYDALGEHRDYPDHVCPGLHCAARTEPAAHGHREVSLAIHKLPKIKAAR